MALLPKPKFLHCNFIWVTRSPKLYPCWKQTFQLPWNGSIKPKILTPGPLKIWSLVDFSVNGLGQIFQIWHMLPPKRPTQAVQFWAVGSRRKATFLSLWRECPNMLQIFWPLETSLGSGPLRLTRFLAHLLPHTCFIKTFKALVIPAHQVQSSWYHQDSGWEWFSVECGDFCTWAITEIRVSSYVGHCPVWISPQCQGSWELPCSLWE